MLRPLTLLAVLFASLFLATTAFAHPHEYSVRVPCEVAEISGTLLIPHTKEKVPCVVIVGGTLSHDRDGRLFKFNVPRRDALARLAEALAGGGYASLRYDQVGYGGSKPTDKWKGLYADQAKAAAAVLAHVRRDARFGPVMLLGESAGAYEICLAAKAGTQADAYLFLGALCSPAEEMYAYNFGRLAAYAESSPERLAWVTKHARYELALGRKYQEMLKAAADSTREEFITTDGDFRLIVGGLSRRREEQADSPDKLFKHITAPALAIAGSRDRNVPPEHAERAAKIMREAGNKKATHLVIEGADHSFQKAPEKEDEAVRERFDLSSFHRPYEPRAYREILKWLHANIPTTAEEHSEDIEFAASRPTSEEPKPTGRASERTEIDAVTDTTPERVQLAPGIEIVPDITDPKRTAGVETLEGRIGPLLLGEGSQAHFIDMPGGMYVEEHPHSSESIIYTVRGKWVLCSHGRRQLMPAGSLFRFAPNIPTGYEVPFGENAYILIFKGDRITKTEGEFIDYLKGMAGRLKTDHDKGTPFLLKELAADHPARVFARKVNAKFDE